MIHRFTSVAACAFACACGGAPPEPQAPEASPTPPTPTEAAPESPESVEAAEAPDAPPRHVELAKVEIEGGGVSEDALKSALAAQQGAFETCYAETKKEVTDLEGRVLITYLFVKGERKSVSASHAGMGAKTINPCFHGAASAAKLEVDPSADRTTIVVTFQMSQQAL